MGGKCDDDEEEEEEVVVNSLCDNTRPLQDIINTSTFPFWIVPVPKIFSISVCSLGKLNPEIQGV